MSLKITITISVHNEKLRFMLGKWKTDKIYNYNKNESST